jgi:hypothetical protein
MKIVKKDLRKSLTKVFKNKQIISLNEIKNLSEVENKIVGCAAIILTGLSYKDENKYLANGLTLLKKIIKLSIDNQGFPKSRNIKQLIFYLKYFILIREWFKESQNIIPEYIDETIYYLGSKLCFYLAKH